MAKPRSEAQRAAWAKYAAAYRPQTDIRPGWIEEHLLRDQFAPGTLLYHVDLGLVIRYRRTFAGWSGETMIEGEVVDQGAGTGFEIGSMWACAVGRLRRVVKKSEKE